MNKSNYLNKAKNTNFDYYCVYKLFCYSFYVFPSVNYLILNILTVKSKI